jgi:ATP-dependent protease ClpP protease subunit
MISATLRSVTALMLLMFTVYCEAETFVNCFGRKDCYVYLKGEISSEMLSDLRSVESDGNKISSVHIGGSDGGDVAAALAIGRLFRSHETTVGVLGHCYSACVFLVVGAVWRLGIDQSINERLLGIHRPYSLAAFQDYSDAKGRIDQLNAEIEAFLREMNVSPALLQAMNSVPGYSVKFLTQQEAAAYGVIEMDPVWEEMLLGERAKQLGISRQELHRRINLRKQLCDPISHAEADRKKACLKSIGLVQ